MLALKIFEGDYIYKLQNSVLYVNIVMEIVTVLHQVKIDINSTAGVGCLNTFNKMGHGFQKSVNFKEKQIYN